MGSANEIQHGGTHYQKMSIQHWDYVVANEIPYLEACAIKYLSRWRDKGGMQDLLKAKHYVEKLIEVEEAKAVDTESESNGPVFEPSGIPSSMIRNDIEFRDRMELENPCNAIKSRDWPPKCEHEYDVFFNNQENRPTQVIEVCVKCLQVKPLSTVHEVKSENLPSYPGNARKSNGQLMCGCYGLKCEGHTETLIGESS